MENHVPQQLTAYLTAAALGAASAMVYDLLRTVRLRRRRDRQLTGLLDGLYIAVLGFLLLWFALRIGQGELRLYMLTGVALGALLYSLTLPPLLRPLWDFWLDAAVALCRLLCRPAALAARWLKKAAAFLKKHFSFRRTCATIKDASGPGGRGRERTAMAQKKTRKKRSNTVLLLVLAVLIVVVGMEIVNVYGRLRDVRAQEAALTQQMEEKTQENEALRSDLSKKDDPDFIKGLARDLLGLAEEGERIFYDVND